MDPPGQSGWLKVDKPVGKCVVAQQALLDRQEKVVRQVRRTRAPDYCYCKLAEHIQVDRQGGGPSLAPENYPHAEDRHRKLEAR